MNNDSHSISSDDSQESDEGTLIEFCASEEEDYIRILMEREIEFGYGIGFGSRNDDSNSLDRNLVKLARSEAISWILKARQLFRFRFQTAYLSITYFDRFLSKRPINSGEMWMIKLLPVACLALAAKMEERKIPLLSDFRFDGSDFGTKLIEKMELFVLSTLKWKMDSITPFSFLHYFITRLRRFDQSSTTNLLARTAPLLVATITEINLMEHRPSSIAAAATLVVLEQKLTRNLLESKMRSVSHCDSIQFEDVFSFYNTMGEIEISQEHCDLLMIRPKRKDAAEASSVTNGLSCDKKRLHPSNCGFECGVAGYKRFR